MKHGMKYEFDVTYSSDEETEGQKVVVIDTGDNLLELTRDDLLTLIKSLAD